MSKTIKLDKQLWDRVNRCAEAAGYSSPQEFVGHVLEKETARLLQEAESDEEITRKLKGLGYLEWSGGDSPRSVARN